MGVGSHQVSCWFGKTYLFWEIKWMHEKFPVKDSCVIDVAVCAISFMCLLFLCVTLHFVLPSYLECSVKWVEFICLCSIHFFRYYMIFLLKSIWNSFQTLCIDGLFSHLFHFTQIEFDDCNDVIILPLIVLVYVSLWSFTCIWLHAQWICDWFSQMNECSNIVYHLIL